MGLDKHLQKPFGETKKLASISTIQVIEIYLEEGFTLLKILSIHIPMLIRKFKLVYI